MRKLTLFQIKILTNFFSDIARGALLSALGFSALGPASLNLKIVTAVSGTFISLVFLLWALEIGKEIKE